MAAFRSCSILLTLLWWQQCQGTLTELKKFLDDLGVPSSSDTCSRSGVTCSGSNYAVDLSSVNGVSGNLNDIGKLTGLTSLKLPPYSAITGPIPSSISACTLLESIDISYLSGLTGPLPTGLFSLPQLKEVSITQCKMLAGSALPADLASFKGEKLTLYGNGFEGSVPAGFGSLPNVLTADLSQNQFSGSVPEFSSTCKLAFLSFSKNALTGSVPASVGNCASLKYFNINSNKLSGSLPSELGKLSVVEQIWLNSNGLTGTIPASVAKLPAIKILRLNANKLEGPLPPLLFTTIEQLFLFANQITGPLPDSVCDLTEVSKLSVRTNKFSGPIPSCLGKLTKLKLLWLFGNDFTGALPANLGDITGLERLRANDNQLTGPLPTGFGTLASLWELHLSNNPFNSALPDLSGLTSLTDLKASNCAWTGPLPGLPPSVQTVLLSGSSLTGPVPSSWQTLPAVRVVDVSNNKISSWVTWGTFPGFGVCTGSGTQVAPEPTWTSLLDFSASGNPLDVSARDFMQTFAYSPQMQRLSCADCGLTGTLEAKSLTRFQWAGECQWHESFLSLQYLDLRKNALTKVIANSQWQLSTLLLSDNQLQEVHPSYFGGTFGSARITRFDITGNPITGHVKPSSAGSCNDWMALDPAHAKVVVSSQTGAAGVCLKANQAKWAPLASQPEVECTGVSAEPGSPQAAGVSVYVSHSFNEQELCRCAAGYHGSGRNCSKTPKNTYTETGNTKVPIPCPVHTIAQQEGADSLEKCLCEPGYFQVSPGACARCPGGTYRDSPGAMSADECISCPKHMETENGVGGLSKSACFCKTGMFLKDGIACASCPLATYAKPGVNGVCEPCGFDHATTAVASATSYNLCACKAGYFHSCEGANCSAQSYTEAGMKVSGFCRPCPSGMDCPGGFEQENGRETFHQQPSVMVGHMSLTGAPHYVFKCRPADRCPGGDAGTCKAGYEGKACGLCPEGAANWQGECISCGGTQIGYIVLFMLVAFAVLIALHAALAGHHEWKVRPLMAMGITGEMLFEMIQVLGVITAVDVVWPDIPILTGLAEFSTYFEIDIPSMVPLPCIVNFMGAFRNAGTYSISALTLPMFVGLSFLLFAVSLFLPPRFRWAYPCTFNLCGKLFSALFVSQIVVTMQPFMCYSHPNGVESSVVRYAGTICGSGDHVFMLIVAVVACLVVLSFFAYCMWVLFHINSIFSAADACERLEQYKFLFEDFRLERSDMFIVFKIKEVALALVVVAEPNDAANQLFLFAIILVFSLVLDCRMWPWRLPFLNFVDAALHFVFALILFLMKGFQEDGGDGTGIFFFYLVGIATCLLYLVAFAIPLHCLVTRGLKGELHRAIQLHKPLNLELVQEEWQKISTISPEDMQSVVKDWEIYDVVVMERCVQVMRPSAAIKLIHDAEHGLEKPPSNLSKASRVSEPTILI